MNGPGETLGSFTHLLGFLLRLRFAAQLRFSMSTMRIYPHSELREVAVRNGILEATDDLIAPRYYNPPPLRLPCAMISLAGKFVARLLGGS